MIRTLLAVMCIFISGLGIGFGTGFEYGTGVPITTLFTEKQESIGIPDITTKTTREARQVVEEAVKDEEYGIGYNCLDYAWDSMRALKWDGQPAWVSGITFEDGTGHAPVLTATTDDGWVFLDPRTGIRLTPVPGGYFAGEKIVDVKVEVPHWVDFDVFVLNPVLEVIE